MVCKVASDKTVNEKFAPVVQHISSIAGRAAFYGSSKSALSMTSAVFANRSYILGQSDFFIDGLRARADFIEAAAMSATSIIVNFFYAIGATVLAMGAFGQSEIMNEAFTRNWMHTKVAFKAALGSAVGSLTPGGAGYFYNRSAIDVVTAIKDDITNIFQAAGNSKLTDKELTRGLISYLKTELAGTGQNGLFLAKRIAPHAIEFLMQATEIKIKGKQAQEISDIEAANKKALKGKGKEEKKALIKEQKADLEDRREAHKLALTQNQDFFNTFFDVFKEDSTFEEIDSYVSNTLDGLANARKGDKGEKAFQKNTEAKDTSYDKIVVAAAKKFTIAKAENNLRDVQNHPVKQALVSEALEIERTAANKLRGKERKDALLAVNKKIKFEKKQNKKVANALQKMKLNEANAQVANASRQIEIFDKYSELQLVKSAHEVAQKRLNRISLHKKKYDKKAYKNERKDLEKRIKAFDKDKTKIETAIAKIYDKLIGKDLSFAKKNVKIAEDFCQNIAVKYKQLGTHCNNVDKKLQASLRQQMEFMKQPYEVVKKQKEQWSLYKTSLELRKSNEVNIYELMSSLMKGAISGVSTDLDKVVSDTSGKEGVVATLDKLIRQFVSTWFTRTQLVVDVEEDGSDIEEDGSDVTEDGSDIEEDGSGVTEDGSDIEEDGSGVTEDGSDIEEDGSDIEEDGSDIEEDGSDIEEDGSDIEEDGSGVTEDGSDIEEDGSDNDLFFDLFG